MRQNTCISHLCVTSENSLFCTKEASYALLRLQHWKGVPCKLLSHKCCFILKAVFGAAKCCPNNHVDETFYVYGVSILVVDPPDAAALGMINVKTSCGKSITLYLCSPSNTRSFDCSMTWIIASSDGLSTCMTKITLVIHNQPMCSCFVPFLMVQDMQCCGKQL
jgi:hypothetical protein